MTRSSLVFTSIFLLAGAVLPAQAAIKCWTNKEGVRECGQSVPPEYAQQGHEVIKEGIVVDEKERAKTQEELAAEREEAALKAERKRQEEERKHQDFVLLQTFSTVEDIERVRDEQIDALEATVSVTRARNLKIQEDLDKRIAAAAEEERAGKAPNEDLLKDIESLKRQTANNEEFIAEKHREQEDIRADYAARIQRFQELQAGRP
ncbi:MAG: hypothetical protein HYY36_00635 [Gammaproteobacteria bacterium]|nr:hypothetical protein [Gammaproteobacteria bacterium]